MGVLIKMENLITYYEGGLGVILMFVLKQSMPFPLTLKQSINMFRVVVEHYCGFSHKQKENSWKLMIKDDVFPYFLYVLCTVQCLEGED